MVYSDKGLVMRKLLFLLLFTTLSPVLFAVSFLDDQLSFDVPTALEIRSSQFEQFYARIAEDANMGWSNNEGEDTLHVVLQQKGLNTSDEKALSQYCRIIIEVASDDSAATPNWLVRETLTSMDSSEKEEYEAFIRRTTEMTTSIINWYPTTYEDIDELFAFRNHYTRKSTSGNISPVEVYSYNIITGIYTITITCAYRQSQALTFVPLINEFLESLVFNFPEDSHILESIYSPNTMSTHKIPGTNAAFIWPESNPSWITVEENSLFKTEQVDYSNLFMEGYLCSISSLKYKISLNDYQISSLLASALNEALTILRTNALLEDLKLQENWSDSNSSRLRYSYTNSIDGSKVYGFCYLLKFNNSQIISVTAEYNSTSGNNPETILQSVMDSLEIT